MLRLTDPKFFKENDMVNMSQFIAELDTLMSKYNVSIEYDHTLLKLKSYYGAGWEITIDDIVTVIETNELAIRSALNLLSAV